MRQKSFISLAAAALLLMLVTGCKKEEPNTDTTASTDTGVTATDTSGSTSTTDTTVTTTAAASSTPLSDDDKKFAMKAAEGGMGEVNLGGLAASKATNADVKTFGQRMQTDHGKAGDDLKQLATSKGLDLPTAINAETQKTSDELSKKSGAAFDKAYMEDMVKDHDMDVAEFKKAQKSVKDADLKAWIDKTLPVIEDHQKMAHDLVKKLK
jgi:putative membrane protein